MSGLHCYPAIVNKFNNPIQGEVPGRGEGSLLIGEGRVRVRQHLAHRIREVVVSKEYRRDIVVSKECPTMFDLLASCFSVEYARVTRAVMATPNKKRLSE